MARNAETVVFVLDVSLSMRRTDIEDAVTMIEQRLVEKLVYNPKDEIAVIVFGSTETNNDLDEELEGGYDGISVAVPWQQVSAETLGAVHKIRDIPQSAQSDSVSAVVVAMDLMVKAKGVMNKGQKRVVLLMPASSTMDAEELESTEAQIDGMSPELARQGIRLQVLVLNPEEPCASESQRSGLESGGGLSRNGSSHAPSATDLNMSLLRRLLGDSARSEGSEAVRSQGVTQQAQSTRTSQSGVTSSSRSETLEEEERHTGATRAKAEGGGKGGGGMDAPRAAPRVLNELIAETSIGDLRQLSSWQPLLHRGRHRVLANTAFRGDLEITPDLKIKVWAYKKTMRQRLPPMKPYSEEAPEGDEDATHEVRLDREFRLHDDPDVVVHPADLVKAYKYGPQVIPITNVDKEAAQIHAEKGIMLLGFTSRDRVPRHYFMGEATLLVPQKGDEEATVSLSAFARALEAGEKVAVARCKLTQRADAGVILAVLTPALSEDPEAHPDGLFCNTIPFAEDIREYLFTPLAAHPPRLQPSEAQLSAAQGLVRALDMGPSLSKGAPAGPWDKGYAEAGSEMLLPEETFNPTLQALHETLRDRLLEEEGVESEVLSADELLQQIKAELPWLSAHGAKQAGSAIVDYKKAFQSSVHTAVSESMDVNMGLAPSVEKVMEQSGYDKLL